MDWLTDATSFDNIHEIFDAISLGGILGLLLVPSFVILLTIGIIAKLAKKRKKHKNKTEHNENNKVAKVELIRPDGTRIEQSSVSGLGLTDSELQKELSYRTVDSKVLDKFTEPEHVMDLNINFDSKDSHKSNKGRRKK